LSVGELHLTVRAVDRRRRHAAPVVDPARLGPIAAVQVQALDRHDDGRSPLVAIRGRLCLSRGLRVGDDWALNAGDAGHPAAGAEAEPPECPPLGRPHRREVFLPLEDAHRIGAAHSHAAPRFHWDLARLADVEHLVAQLGEHGGAGLKATETSPA
jgi:hypothetical protein